MRIMLTETFIPHFLHGLLQKIKFLSDIDVAEADHVWINLLDMLFDHVAPMRPLQKRLRNGTVKMLHGPLIRKNVPVHYFETNRSDFHNRLVINILWASYWSGIMNNRRVEAFGRKCVRCLKSTWALVLHHTVVGLIHALSLHHLGVNINSF